MMPNQMGMGMQPGMQQQGMMGMQQQPGMMGGQPMMGGQQMGFNMQPGMTLPGGGSMNMRPGMQMGQNMGQMQQFMQHPSKTYQDGRTVHFPRNRMVMRATYGPQGTNQDVTQQVQQLIAQGQRVIYGGIHTALGDPNPGTAKIFQVWYAGKHGGFHIGRRHPQYQQFRAQRQWSSSSSSSSFS